VFDKEFLKENEENLKKWDKDADKFRAKKSRPRFITVSGEEVNELYTPADVDGAKFNEKIGYPGQFPYTRGVHHTMYRSRLWTMRQFSGMGTPKQTNERYHYLLKNGQTGLSVAFDLPTLMGYDSDHPRSLGEVGKCGVAVDSLADMEIIFDGINLGEVSTSMTINAPASVLLAMYLAVAEKQGVPFDKLRGTNILPRKNGFTRRNRQSA